MNDLINSLRGFTRSKKKEVALTSHPQHRTLKRPKSFDSEEGDASDLGIQEDQSSQSRCSIISQPPLTEAGESTEEGGVKRKRVRPNFFRPDQRPDIVIFRESNQEQLALEESLLQKSAMNPLPRKRGRAQKRQLARVEEETKGNNSPGARPKRSRKATQFLRPDPRPDTVILREPNPEQPVLEVVLQQSLMGSEKQIVDYENDSDGGEAEQIDVPEHSLPKDFLISGGKGRGLKKKGKQCNGDKIVNGACLTTSEEGKEHVSKSCMFVLSHDDDSSEEKCRGRATKKERRQNTTKPKRKLRNIKSTEDITDSEEERGEGTIAQHDQLSKTSSTQKYSETNKGGRFFVGNDSHEQEQIKRLISQYDSGEIDRNIDIGQGKKDKEPTNKSGRKNAMALNTTYSPKGSVKGNVEANSISVSGFGGSLDTKVQSPDRSNSKTHHPHGGSEVSPYARKATTRIRSAEYKRKTRLSSSDSDDAKAKAKTAIMMAVRRPELEEHTLRCDSSGADSARMSSDDLLADVEIETSQRIILEIKEVEWTDDVARNEETLGGSKADSLGSLSEPFLATLAKGKKQPKSRSKLPQVRERSATVVPKQLSAMLDEKSGIAYSTAFAILRKRDSKTALDFCQRCLQEYYGQAKRIIKDFAAEESFAKHRKLLDLRKTIVGLWCVSARLFLNIADMVPVGRRTGVKRKHLFDRLDKMQLPKLRNSLVDAALMILGKAACCPVAGSHAWIALSYSKIVQTAFGKEYFRGIDVDDGDKIISKQRSLEAAEAVCRRSLGFFDDAQPYFDQDIVDRLVAIGIVGESTSTQLLQQRAGFVLLGSLPTFVDEASESFLTVELDLLSAMKTSDSPSAKPEFTVKRTLSSILSQLPLAPDEVRTQILTSTPIEREVSSSNDQAGVIASAESFAVMEETDEMTTTYDVVTFNSLYCFGVEMMDQNYARDKRKGEMWEVKQCENEHAIVQSFHVQENCTSAIIDGCEDVTFYCPACCSPEFSFSTKSALQKHLTECDSKVQSVASAELPAQKKLRFGDSKLIGNWSIHSFDPENGPLLSPDELLDVLDYSVELFEITEKDLEDGGIRRTSHSLSEPYILGQCGLRCRYCTDRWNLYGEEGSVVFPKSIDKLPQAFWHLSLSHLDKCEKQPREVRNWHQEYRKHVRLNSFLAADYWKNVASEMNVVSLKAGGLIVH